MRGVVTLLFSATLVLGRPVTREGEGACPPSCANNELIELFDVVARQRLLISLVLRGELCMHVGKVDFAAGDAIR